MKKKKSTQSNYMVLLVISVILFFIMFAVMYTMIASFSHAYVNWNQFMMVILMLGLMTIIGFVFRASMYEDKTTNGLIVGGSVLLVVIAFFLLRTQSVIGDKQFLRSMIPHHSSAILMCQNDKLEDPEIIQLCDGIISAQEQEIAQMKTILERLNN